MNPLLLFIVQTSIVGSITVALYLLLHPLRQKILSAGWQYSMVKTMAVFFILPVGLMGSLVTSVSTLRQTASEAVLTAQNLQPAEAIATPIRITGAMVQPIIEPIVRPIATTLHEGTKTGNLGNVLFFLWLTGALLFILHQVLSFWVFYNKVVLFNNKSGVASVEEVRLCNEIALRMGLQKKIAVAVNPMIHGPMVFFGKSNMVVLPKTAIPYEDLRYVFYHELTHIKRRDLIFKFLFLCICAVHWFNPLCHILARQLNTWCELSCDESVVKNLSHAEKKEYGLSIINLMYCGKSTDKLLCSSYACHKKNLKRRLNMLIKQRKYMKTKLAFSMALTILMGSVALSTGVLASNLEADAAAAASGAVINQEVTVLETSELTGRATKIQWNDKLYTMDSRYVMESSDQGETWEEFISDYESLKLVYTSLGVGFKTIEEYKAQVEEARNTPPYIPNINPDAVYDWVHNNEVNASLVAEMEKGGIISEPIVLTKGIDYGYNMPGFDTMYSDDGKIIPNTYVYGLHVDELYESIKEQNAVWVEMEFLTQEQADVIWKDFLVEFNLTEQN